MKTALPLLFWAFALVQCPIAASPGFLVPSLHELAIEKGSEIRPPVTFCPSKGNFPWEDWIAGVKLGSSETVSGKSQYSDFTATTFDLDKNTPVNFALTSGFSYFTWDEYWAIWIDLNHDGVFSSPDEIVTKQLLPHPANGTPTAVKTGSFTIPASALTGPTRMRVSMKRGGYPTSCETFAFGEVEDYTVNIGAGSLLPNIEVQNWDIQPHSHAPGETTGTHFNLLNTGNGAVSGSYLVGIFLSTDAGWGPNDHLIGSATLDNTPAGADLPQNLAFTIPPSTVLGDYFLILKADFVEQVAETNDLDNSLVVPFTVGFCSLTAQVSNESCSGNYASATVLVTGVNAGTSWLGAYSTPGGVSFVSGNYGVPTQIGVWKGTNNSAGVSVFDPNVSGCSVGFTINCPGNGLPDLASNAWEIIPANGSCYTNPGEPMGFFGGLAFNNGTAPAAAFTAKAFLSTDNILSADDILWQTINYPSLGVTGSAGSPAGLNITAPVPAATAPGNYFAIVKIDADNQIVEANEANNEFITALQIGPGGPCGGGQICPSKSDFPWEDWIGAVQVGLVGKTSGKSAYSDFTPTIMPVGNGTAVALTAFYSYFTFDEYWRIWVDLNKDGDFSDAGEQVFEQILSKPANGTTAKTLTGALNLPAGTFSGTTRMRVSMKRGAFAGPCETLPFGEVEDFTAQLGGGGQLPDLQLANLINVPATVQKGTAFNFNFDLKNAGTANASGNFTIKSWLSTDNLLSADDYQDGTVPTGNLPAGATIPQVLGGMTVAQSVAPGQYFLILKADADGAVTESNEANNLLVSVGKITVAPGSNSGADLELTLTADKSTAPIYSNVTYVLKAKNNGNLPVQSAKITIGVCLPASSSGFSNQTGMVYAGTPPPPTVGSFDLVAQEWSLANLQPGATATLTIPLFTLTGAERKILAYSFIQTPTDPDSQPGAKPANCTPSQDDEAVWTLNAGQSLVPGDDRANEASDPENYLLFPNPAGESVNVVMPNLVGKPVRLTLFDQLGLVIFEEKIENLEFPQHILDLSNMRNGQYFLQILAENQRPITKKLIVARNY